MTSRASWEDFKFLVKDRQKKGFTVIQTVVGVPPETDIFSTEASNSGGTPFTKDFKINQKYFLEVDRKIKYLLGHNLTPCIFGAWGHHIDIIGKDLMMQWWKEIVKRYAKYEVIFCLTGEADIFPQPKLLQNNLFKNKLLSYIPNNIKTFIKSKLISPKIYSSISDRLKKWDEVARYIKKIDKYNRLLTVHVHQQKTASELFDNPDWLDIDSIQSGHSKESLGFMISAILSKKNKKQPIINLEPWYEGINGNFFDYYQRVAFWACILSGAAGHTYGAHGIWQMATHNDDYLKHWGTSNWKTAINYKGAVQIGLAKKYLEKLEFHKLKPTRQLITPSNNKQNLYLPIAAEVGGNEYFIYFPDKSIQRNFKLFFNKKISVFKCQWIDPRSMKIVAKARIKSKKNQLKIIQKVNAKDILLYIKGSL